MENKSERKICLDAAKGWGILMVMYGHITQKGNPFDLYFSIYKISIFFIVSGYLLHMTGSMHRYTLPAFLKRSFRSIGVPYFCYSVIFILYQLIIDLLRGAGRQTVMSHLVNRGYLMISLRGYSTMWFLSAIFLGEILFALVWHSPLRWKILSAILVIPLCIPVNPLLNSMKANLSSGQYKLFSYPFLALSRGIMAFGYIGAGYLLYGVLRKIRRIRDQLATGIICSAAVIVLSRFLRHADLNHMLFGKPFPLYLFCSILGPVGVILLFQAVEHWYKMPLLSWTGRNSLIIMATHGTLRFKNICYAGFFAVYKLTEQSGLAYGLQCIGVEAHLLLMEAGVAAVVNRCFPFLAGRGFQRNRQGELSKGDHFANTAQKNT